ncbi:MAG: BatD family protein [Sulfurimonas sp.]|uniref:BatD family protein n=1 Tax=Sulfurimonas sp. TaxID=2022749 RepID=UPI002622F39E|nr:BatD family protein [Sulfurimonas sp.]MCW8894808.1 BatD family protein [Sulfurimonas sp.]MCW8955007.1 BatD family protein [Sulfurimonas sp.]
MNRYFKLLFLLIIPHVIYASVTAKVDYKTVELGEMVTYSLNISGEDITRPNIQRLCDTDVISTSSQTSVQIVNGNITKSYILSYKFVPQKSCTIEPIEVDIGGKTELSNPVEIEVKPVTGAKDKNFELTLSTDKKELFVGETFDLLLTFKQKIDSQAVDSEFIAPELKGFWIKNKSQPISSRDGDYTVTKVIYTMAPQREGSLKITKAKMRIASRSNRADSWGSWIPTIRWKTYFSNELDINVKALPSGVTLVGDFTIEAKVDKKEINVNEAVNVTVEVTGVGNLEDIKTFKPYIDGVSVFDEKIAIEDTLLTQKIAFVAERDFKIPAFSLKYFDTETKKIKTISSKEIDIKVKNAKVKEELTIKRETPQAKVDVSSGEFDKLTLVIAFIIGLTCGILIMMIKPLKRLKKEKKSSLKEPKVLLVKLFPFKDDEEVKNIIDLLEKSIYSGQKLELDKKALKEILKKYKID